MEIGIDSFAALRPVYKNPTNEDNVETIAELIETSFIEICFM